jgi:hypothetical protein
VFNSLHLFPAVELAYAGPPSFRKRKMMANNARVFPSGRREWEALNGKQVAEFEDARDEDERILTDRAKADAQTTWADKYAAQLDVAGMNTFINTLRQKNKNALAQATARADSHLNWIRSERLINAFDLYDRNDAVKKTDSALDEWMRNQDQSKNYLNPKHILNLEARFFYLVSNITRAVARKGMGSTLEMKVLARANALMQFCVGDLAEELEYHHMNSNSYAKSPDALFAKAELIGVVCVSR